MWPAVIAVAVTGLIAGPLLYRYARRHWLS